MCSSVVVGCLYLCRKWKQKQANFWYSTKLKIVNLHCLPLHQIYVDFTSLAFACPPEFSPRFSVLMVRKISTCTHRWFNGLHTFSCYVSGLRKTLQLGNRIVPSKFERSFGSLFKAKPRHGRNIYSSEEFSYLQVPQ